MKIVMQVIMGGAVMLFSLGAKGQAKVDEQKMEQDIEIAENVLSTLIRQQVGGKRGQFFPMEVNGSYMAGYGVTFHMPRGGPFNVFLYGTAEPSVWVAPGQGFAYSYSTDKKSREEAQVAKEKAEKDKLGAEKEKQSAEERKQKERTQLDRADREVLRKTYSVYSDNTVVSDTAIRNANDKFIKVAKNFLADYGDLIGQLKGDERIVITNRGDDFNGDFGFRWQGGESRRTTLSVEAKRDDIAQLKQGKLNRDQFMGRLKVVNTETADKLDPDLEVLASMFGRLYREDLSKTYYSQGDVTYERLKDFGAIYYMRVYSSIEGEEGYVMPTLSLNKVSSPERDKKVKELYPKFEKELKENVIEYGRTLRSLGDNEQLVFRVKLTRCTDCGIPGTLELSVPSSVLKDYNSGKITKDAAVGKVNVKQSGQQ
jgi:hypothetical protein